MRRSKADTIKGLEEQLAQMTKLYREQFNLAVEFTKQIEAQNQTIKSLYNRLRQLSRAK